MNLCRLCRCHFDGPPLPTYAGGQQGGHFSGFWDFSVKPDAILPASAGGQRGGGDVADGGRLQGRGGHARAHEEHLWLAVDLFCGPWKMITSTEYIKQSHQQVLIT